MGMKILKNGLALLLLTIFLTGCLPPAVSTKTTGENGDFDPQRIKSTDFATETRKLTLITRNPATDAARRAEAHRRLAILFLIPRNPARDLARGLEELGHYLEAAPEKMDRPAAAGWATAIKFWTEQEELEKKISALKKAVADLDEKNRQLAREKEDLGSTNAELKKIIEKLKNLDLSLEKKRRDFR